MNEPFLRKLMEGHTKNQFISLIFSWDTANLSPVMDWKILQSDWLRAFWAIISEARIFPNMKFVQAYNNYSNIDHTDKSFHYRPYW